jgi:hypothetical protein
MREQRLREALLDARIPDEQGARERGWRIARAAYVASPPALKARRRRPSRRILQVAIAIGLIAALVSPAGASVRHWVRDAVDSGTAPTLPALTSLPAPGSLLVESARGPWIVREDGSKRLLGSYGEATWSPHGLYVAAATRHELAAVDPLGEVRWTLSRQGPVRRPSWSPDGYRVAYLNGSELRVVGGDGTGDRLLARGVSPVAAAWEPRSPGLLSYVAAGRLRTVQADTGRVAVEAGVGDDLVGLAWSADGERLLVTTRTALVALDREGHPAWSARAPRGTDIVAAAISPAGDRAATVLVSKSGDHSTLATLGPGGGRTLFEGPGRFEDVTYSPDAQWLLLTWRSADQWLFVNLADPGRVVAISEIAAQFDPGTTSAPAFPSIAGWCCPAGG